MSRSLDGNGQVLQNEGLTAAEPIGVSDIGMLREVGVGADLVLVVHVPHLTGAVGRFAGAELAAGAVTVADPVVLVPRAVGQFSAAATVQQERSTLTDERVPR